VTPPAFPLSSLNEEEGQEAHREGRSEKKKVRKKYINTHGNIICKKRTQVHAMGKRGEKEIINKTPWGIECMTITYDDRVLMCQNPKVPASKIRWNQQANFWNLEKKHNLKTVKKKQVDHNVI
jgi:hypothetical protein